jgi:hypothetical protein
MQIEEHLPQYRDNPALIVITGKQLAEIYYAVNAEIKLIKTLEEPKMEYTDTKEGAFRSLGARGVSNVGAPYEEKNQVVVARFLNKLHDSLLGLLQEYKVKDLIIFSPEYVAKLLEEKLPSMAQKKLKYHFFGNYIHHHPFDILKMIREKGEEDEEKKVPQKKEAKKLLDMDEYVR